MVAEQLSKGGSDLEVAGRRRQRQEKVDANSPGCNDVAEGSLQPGADGQEDSGADKADKMVASLFIFSLTLIFRFVSSSALHSEQGFQGHLAGCKAWG